MRQESCFRLDICWQASRIVLVGVRKSLCLRVFLRIEMDADLRKRLSRNWRLVGSMGVRFGGRSDEGSGAKEELGKDKFAKISILLFAK